MARGKKSSLKGQVDIVARHQGRRVPVQSDDQWSDDFLATLGAWKEEIERPRRRPITKSSDPFD